MEIFINNIIWIREKYGLSKKAMSEIMHIGVQSLSRLEKGELPCRMCVGVLFYLEAHFGIPSDAWLRTRFDDEKELP